MSTEPSDDLIALSDALYLKTKQLFEDSEINLLTMSHAFIVNHYTALRCPGPLDYNPATGIVSGIAGDFHENTPFQPSENHFIPHEIATIIENFTPASPAVPWDYSQKTQLALTYYCVSLGMNHLADYHEKNRLAEFMACKAACDDTDQFHRIHQAQQQESYRTTMLGRLNNLGYGIETLLQGDTAGPASFRGQMADIAGTLTTLCEKAAQATLSPENVSDLVVHRHNRRRETFSHFNPQ